LAPLNFVQVPPLHASHGKTTTVYKVTRKHVTHGWDETRLHGVGHNLKEWSLNNS